MKSICRFSASSIPIGLPLNLASNAREVLDAAEENWGMYEAMDEGIDDPPLTVRILVQPGGELSPDSRYTVCRAICIRRLPAVRIMR